MLSGREPGQAEDVRSGYPRAMRRLLVVLLVGAVLQVSCAASPRTPEGRAGAIEAQVWSPYCAGRLLVDCTTRQADQLRTEIRRRVRDGQTDAQVLAWLEENYGDEVLARPSRGPRGVVVWVVPLLAGAAGLVLLAALLRRWSRRGRHSLQAEVPPQAAPTDEWVQRVRDEVERGL